MKNAAAKKEGKQGESKRHKPFQKNPIRQQFELLQQTVGNQKVMQMMQAGIIPKNMPEATPQEMASSKVNRQVLEQQRINIDREALLPKILQAVAEKREKMETLKNAKPGAPIYANVTISLKYVSIPGEGHEALDVYNTTDLINVDLSYQNVNQKGSPHQESKGFAVQETFSFIADANEKKAEEERPKEEKEKKADKKKSKENPAEKGEAKEQGSEGSKEESGE